jgi:hypothetical protein
MNLSKKKKGLVRSGLTPKKVRQTMITIILNTQDEKYTELLSEKSNDELFDIFAPIASPYMKKKDMRDYKTVLGIRHLYRGGSSYDRK